MSTYQKQSRGDRSDYERYLEGMDASMQQKVALTAAHLLGEGWLADMGMGSGTGSEALAALYPNIRVTGVDINPEMVKLAQERYRLPNLDFRVGDIGGRCFDDNTLDVIFNSSVLHHVTTFNDYDYQMATRAIASQVEQLKVDGNLIIRDFLKPEGGTVWLDLPPDTASLFRRFAHQFRALKPEPERGFPFREVESSDRRWRRFEVDRVHAVEFLLRKDYVDDWETEVLEEYTYFTQAEFESTLRAQSLRILASTPLRNPWIIRNRFKGRFRLFTTSGEPLEYPPTNYLIVGEKVDAGEGVAFTYGEEHRPGGYLELSHYRHKRNGTVKDLVRRPNATLDVVPYFLKDGEVYVIARKSYPRPILGLCRPRLDGALSPSYVTEPIVMIQGDKPLAQTVEEGLLSGAGIDPGNIKRFHFGGTTYPSPGGLQEEVRAVFVEVEEILASEGSERVRAVSARQLLRAAQVGGLPDARLELHCFELLKYLGYSAGPWIGESLTLRVHSVLPPEALQHFPERPPRRAYERTDEAAGFLHLRAREFRETTPEGAVCDTTTLEYVTPARLGLHTVAAALIWRHKTGCFMGICDEDFPAAQCFQGHSNLWVTPAWRLPTSVNTLTGLESFLKERLVSVYGLNVNDVFTLGGPYFPSAGATPEVVYPLACDVEEVGPSLEPLTWVALEELLKNFDSLRDGHLKTVLSRVARAARGAG